MIVKSQLQTLGYNQYFDKKRILKDVAIAQIARVTAEHKGAYEVATVNGEYRAVVTGKKMLSALSRDDYPAVGDWVIIKE
ncbi:MAG: ribosome small subunit-dependent GTPase, partial [Candidatus Shapirobacteria bacterium]